MRKKRVHSKARKARTETSADREVLEGKTHLISEAAKFIGVIRPILYARIEQGAPLPYAYPQHRQDSNRTTRDKHPDAAQTHERRFLLAHFKGRCPEQVPTYPSAGCTNA